jgi:hypothetical protein
MLHSTIFKENFFRDSLFHTDHCLPSFCFVIGTILSKYSTVLFVLYLITLALHQCLFVTKNFRPISRSVFASKIPASRPLKGNAEEKFVKLSVQNLLLSWSLVLIELFRSFVIGSSESEWQHVLVVSHVTVRSVKLRLSSSEIYGFSTLMEWDSPVT